MEYDLVIKNGAIVTASSTYSADIGIKGQQIAAIGRQLTGDRIVDAAGKLVTPGAVDIHVHMQMPIGKFTSADDFYSGTVAAAFGGTTTIIDFVEREYQQSFLEAIAARRAEAHDFILGLEDHKGRTGYDAHLGERGVNLSGQALGGRKTQTRLRRKGAVPRARRPMVRAPRRRRLAQRRR